MAAKEEGTHACSGAGNMSSLTVAVTGAFSSFDDGVSVTTGAGFSVSLGKTYSGRVTAGGASVPTELLLPTSNHSILSWCRFCLENLAIVTVKAQASTRETIFPF